MCSSVDSTVDRVGRSSTAARPQGERSPGGYFWLSRLTTATSAEPVLFVVAELKSAAIPIINSLLE